MQKIKTLIDYLIAENGHIEHSFDNGYLFVRLPKGNLKLTLECLPRTDKVIVRYRQQNNRIINECEMGSVEELKPWLDKLYYSLEQHGCEPYLSSTQYEYYQKFFREVLKGNISVTTKNQGKFERWIVEEQGKVHEIYIGQTLNLDYRSNFLDILRLEVCLETNKPHKSDITMNSPVNIFLNLPGYELKDYPVFRDYYTEICSIEKNEDVFLQTMLANTPPGVLESLHYFILQSSLSEKEPEARKMKI